MEILLQEFEKAKLLSSCVQCEDFVSATKLLACSHVLCEDCYSQMGSRCPHCAGSLYMSEFGVMILSGYLVLHMSESVF